MFTTNFNFRQKIHLIKFVRGSLNVLKNRTRGFQMSAIYIYIYECMNAMVNKIAQTFRSSLFWPLLYIYDLRIGVLEVI